MDHAAERILRWYLSNLDDADEHLEPTVEALRDGVRMGDVEAIAYRDAILALAEAAARDSEDAEPMARLFEIHREAVELDAAERKLDALEELGAISATPDAGPVEDGRRDARIREIVAEIVD
jgi:hypothetical protein